MGLRGFFKWLKHRYPQCMMNYIPNAKALYIDMNSIIHRFNSYEAIVRYIDYVVSLVNPQELVYIAMDGVAPQAKLNSQRKRRYSQETNHITPGTEYMYNLGAYIKNYILLKLEDDWSHLDVVFSDSNQPGEGEIKIMEYLNQREDLSHIIFSPDNDVVLTCLLSRQSRIHVLKETEAITVVSIDQLSKYLLLEYDLLKNFSHFNLRNVIQDFVLLCLLLGSDFIPCIPMLDISEGALEGLIRLYILVFNQLGGYLVENGHLVLYRLDIFFRELSRVEEKYYQRKVVPREITREAIQVYVEGLEWTMSYYSGNLLSWTWSYQCSFVPNPSDLKNVADLSISFHLGCPLSPYQQLISVLPPSSAHLVPEALSSIFQYSEYFPAHLSVENTFPLIDLDGLDTFFESKKELLTDEELARNETSSLLLISNQMQSKHGLVCLVEQKNLTKIFAVQLPPRNNEQSNSEVIATKLIIRNNEDNVYLRIIRSLYQIEGSVTNSYYRTRHNTNRKEEYTLKQALDYYNMNYSS